MNYVTAIIPMLILLVSCTEPCKCPPAIKSIKISGAAPTVHVNCDSSNTPDAITISGAMPAIIINEDTTQLSGGWLIKKLATDTLILDGTTGEWIRTADTTYYITTSGDTLVKTGY